MDRIDALRSRTRPEAWVAMLAAAVVLLTLAGALYGVKPAWQAFRKASDQIKPGEARTPAQLEDLRASVTERKGQVEAFRAEIYGGSAQVSEREVESFVIASLDEHARARGVDLVSVTPAPTKRVLDFEELPYDVELRGSYIDLFEWLRAAETALRPMVVKQFSLRPEGQSARVEMDVRLVSYLSPERS